MHVCMSACVENSSSQERRGPRCQSEERARGENGCRVRGPALQARLRLTVPAASAFSAGLLPAFEEPCLVARGVPSSASEAKPLPTGPPAVRVSVNITVEPRLHLAAKRGVKAIGSFQLRTRKQAGGKPWSGTRRVICLQTMQITHCIEAMVASTCRSSSLTVELRAGRRMIRLSDASRCGSAPCSRASLSLALRAASGAICR